MHLRLAALGRFQAHREEKGELLFPRHPRVSSILRSPPSAGETHALIAIPRVQRLHALDVQGIANDSSKTPRETLQLLQWCPLQNRGSSLTIHVRSKMERVVTYTDLVTKMTANYNYLF